MILVLNCAKKPICLINSHELHKTQVQMGKFKLNAQSAPWIPLTL